MIPDHPEITFREKGSEYDNQNGIFLRDEGNHKYVIKLDNGKELTVSSFHVFEKGTCCPVFIKVKPESDITKIQDNNNDTFYDNVGIVFGGIEKEDERTKNHRKILKQMYPKMNVNNIDPDDFFMY